MADIQKSAFALSEATIMIGQAFVDDVFSLTPSVHSVGMAQEVRVAVDSSRNELLNGIAQSVVDSKRTNVRPSITGSVYEMTAKNFMTAQGLAGSVIAPKRGRLASAAAAAAVSLSITSDPVPGEASSAITALTDIPAGSTLLIQRPTGEVDFIFPTKSSGAATGTGPFTVPIASPYAIPAGMSFPIGSSVWIVQEVPVASIDEDSLFCVKVTGTLSAFNRPVTYVAPKVRMVKGFELGFSQTQYGAMPWEMSPQLMSVGEAASMPRLSEIGTRRSGNVYVGG